MTSKATAHSIISGNLPVEEEDLVICDDLLRLRAADREQVPLLCFPKSERGTVDYEQFTGREIYGFVDHAAKYYMRCGLEPVGDAVGQDPPREHD